MQNYISAKTRNPKMIRVNGGPQYDYVYLGFHKFTV